VDPQPQQDTAQEVAAPAPPPSTEAGENESSLMSRFIRGVSGFFGGDASSDADAETGATEEQTTDQTVSDEPAWTPPATRAEHDALVRREAQSMKDKELARIAREQQATRTQADWDRIKALAEGGDTWAMGEWATEQVRQAAAREQQDAAYAQFLSTHVPLFDKSYLDPLLSALPKDAWTPIVGDGLTTLEDRAAAMPRIIAAHREKAVADALTDESFVRRLLGSQSFRVAWAKSPVVREQYLATMRGDVDEPDAPPGTAVGRSADMDAILRAGFGA
jgi:hypothetical protein